jgi:hypothetical protein
MKRLLVAFAVLVVLSGCAGKPVTKSSPTRTPNAKTYTNAKYRFSVTYDSKVFKAGGVEFDGLFNGAFAVRSHGQAVAYLFAVSDRQMYLRLGQAHGPADLRHVLDATVNRFSQDTKHGSVGPVTLDGVSGLKTHGTGGGMTFDVYVVGDGKYVYTLMPTTETRDWSTLKPAMDKLVQSFRVLK